ncbi:MltR family transcriptional regulator [Luteibacter sp. UNCMF366Tsu5.1]|uniref:MltR family transcriptional regulator n=1 Tax=Luteibacter sp. UNCMF366Tsu5.1 TaxID=1502758 RepID=UPI0009089620|nr:MltR family transcriptional regulator [Luteibacter sp. UNCMF366Tsu5.1]SFW74482.1 Mannitol repressor [Luteibacter sp. UNCMF366Tsu5.1]
MADENHQGFMDEQPDHSLSELNRFLRRAKDQDDRALVLSLGAFLEDTLGRLLMAYFRDCKATKDLVEGFNAPLGTFSARIKAGYAFGLLTIEQYKDLDLLRKVRNAFAHDWKGVDLDRPDIKDMVRELSGYTVSPDERPSDDTRERLLATLSTCCLELQLFLVRLVEGRVNKAPDVSHRLTTIPPTVAPGRRFV